MKKIIALLILLPIHSFALDIINTATPSSPPQEKSIYDFQSKEDFLKVIASENGRAFLYNKPNTYIHSRAHFGKYLEKILKNSYGLAYTLPPSEEYQPSGDFVGDLCRKSIRGYSPSDEGALETIRKLAKVHNYENSSGFFAETINDIRNLQDFTGTDPYYENNLESFNDSLSFYSTTCSDTESGKAFLQTFKAFLQDVSNEMEAYVKPNREKFIKDALALKAQREDSILALKAQNEAGEKQKAARAQCMQSNAYELYTAASGLQLGRSTITMLRQQLQMEDAITKESGVVNTTKKYSLGKQIKETEEIRKVLFVSYKRLGGRESSMNEVKAPQNPCQ